MKILLISNMYPSAKDKTYGTFVKMFKEGIERNTNDILFDCCFIRGRSNNFMVKVYKYFVFYSVIVYLANLDTTFLCNLIYPTFVALVVYRH